MAGIGLGLGIIISALTTKYRDLTVLVGFGVQLLMYATPIAYPMSFLLGKSYGNVIQYNPLSAIAEGFRFALFERGGFEISSLAYSTGFMIITMIIGLITFNKVEKSFMDTV
jgi:lipopolysaccharide transport system permease protein